MGIRAERAARAELKKEKIRVDIWRFTEDCVEKNLSLEQTAKAVNTYIEVLKRKNPQENHLVSAVCCEIRQDSVVFAKKMKSKFLSTEIANPVNPS
jgi:hypothetical protein